MNHSRNPGVRQRVACGLLIALASLAAVCIPVRASGLAVVLVDNLTLDRVFDTVHGPLRPEELRGGVIALVSPGLPHGRDPVGNLYATLTAGDVVGESSPQFGLLQRQLHAFRADRSVEFIRLGDVAAPGRMRALRDTISRLRATPSNALAPGILLVGVAPPFDPPGSRSWESLTPIVWLPCQSGTSDAAVQPSLTSDTTQTSGLIALRDIAPTILAAEDVPIPSEMSGHPARLVEMGASVSRDAYLREMERVARVSRNSIAPFGWVFGLGAGAILLLGIGCVLGRVRSIARVLRYLVAALVAVPLALMLAACRPLDSPAAYLAEIAVIAAILAMAPRIQWLLFLSALAIIVDGFCGSLLVSRALISYYWLSGIRFYGIGNEYMGVLIGVALTAPFAGGTFRRSGIRLAFLAVWFCLALFVLAYPQFGAKAGGAVTAMAAFLTCWWAVWRNKNPSALTWLVGVVLGFASVVAFAEIAHHLGARSTHIQAAATALSHGRLGYIALVAARKARMAIDIAFAPGALTGIVGLAVVYALWLRSGLRPRVAEYLSTRAEFACALGAGLWGMLAAVLFNDSGSVAALLLFGILGLSVLYGMLDELCASSPSMLEMSESASPSATSSNSAPILSSP